MRALGVIDLPTIQKKLNLHYSLTLDLFGQEVSTNAANAFNAGVKGRYREHRLDDDHKLTGAIYPILQIVDDAIRMVDAPALSAINMRLRDDYTHDAAGGVGRWNKIIESAGVKFELKLPHAGFNRKIGVFSGRRVSPEGKFVSGKDWDDNSTIGCRRRPTPTSSNR